MPESAPSLLLFCSELVWANNSWSVCAPLSVQNILRALFCGAVPLSWLVPDGLWVQPGRERPRDCVGTLQISH